MVDDVRQCPFPDCGAIIAATAVDCPVCYRDLGGVDPADLQRPLAPRLAFPYGYRLVIASLVVAIVTYALAHWR